MAENSLLKEILDTLSDPDTVKIFAAVHGLVGNSEVEHRLKELEWNEHIENLWQEVLPAFQPSLKRLQDSLDDDDKPSTSGYDVLSTSEPPRKKQRKEVLSSPQSPSTDDNRQYGGGGLGSESEDESEKPYYIWKRDVRTFKKDMARETTFKVKFNEQWRGDKLVDIQTKLHNMFDDLLSQARGHDADLGRVVLSHPSLNNPIVVPLQSWEHLNADVVMEEITKVLNSNESLPVDENMIVTVGSIDIPKGGGNPKKLPITSLFGPKNSIKRKKITFSCAK